VIAKIAKLQFARLTYSLTSLCVWWESLLEIRLSIALSCCEIVSELLVVQSLLDLASMRLHLRFESIKFGFDAECIETLGW